MAERLIGSLIYGEHEAPKPRRSWKERWKVPAIIAVALLLIAGAAYKFANYREESQVRRFLEDVRSGRYEDAYARWDASGGGYTLDDFLDDWGKDGYYTEGMTSAAVIDSNNAGSSVIVYVQVDSYKEPIALRVDKSSLRLSFSPVNKYEGRKR